MKNSIYNKENQNVPSVHPGCSLAEPNIGDIYDKPLPRMNIIPKGVEIKFVEEKKEYDGCDGENVDIEYVLPPEIQNPSSIRKESVIQVSVPSGAHPFTYLKENGIDITDSWVFLREDVVDVLRKLPCRYHEKTVAYGEFFRFEDFTEISLQKVEYFPNWKIIREGKDNNVEFFRPDIPETIIELVME